MRENRTWTDVWRLVAQRQKDLGLGTDEMAARCGISPTIYLKGRRDGYEIKHPQKVARVEVGCDWGIGAIAAFLARGVEPTVIIPPVDDDVRHRVEQLEQAVELLASRLHEANDGDREIAELLASLESERTTRQRAAQ